MECFKAINLLIVDDNDFIVDAMKKLLKNTNHINIVGSCSDGSEVLSFVQSNKTDAILMDIIMKKVDGFEAVKQVKRYNSKIKIIGFSLINHIHFVNEVLDSGADGFISKYEADKELIIAELNRVMSLYLLT